MYQGSRCETLESKLNALEEVSKETSQHEMSVEQRKALVERAKRLKLEYMSKATIKKTTKSCPSCKVPIEKNSGWVKRRGNAVHCCDASACMC